MTRIALLCFVLGCAARSDSSVQPVTEAEPALRSVPGPEAFQLGPGDRISLHVWRQDDLTSDLTVAPDGTLSFPLAGTLRVSGLTYPELVAKLSTAFSQYYENPQITVNIVEVASQKVFVVGEVDTPSVLELGTPMTVLEALTKAGGINQYARTSNVLLVRGGLETPELYTIDVDAVLYRGDTAQNVWLRQGDILVVPTRTITNAARFFRDVQTILAPFLAGSAIYRNALGGGAQGTSSVLE